MPIDYSNYPPNWKSEIVPRILDRDDHRCKFCRVDNGAFVWSGKLYTKQNGVYSWRTLWFTNLIDLKLNEILLKEGSIKSVKVVLTVAHLDHDEENHDVSDDRLAALCQKCHLAYDAKEKYQRTYLGKRRNYAKRKS